MPNLNKRPTISKPRPKPSFYSKENSSHEPTQAEKNSACENETEEIKSSADSPRSNTRKSEILYSKKAYKEGYRFDSMTPEEQEMTKSLYISEEALSGYLSAQKTMLRVLENPEYKPPVNHGAGIPIDGWYYGYIYACKPSKTNPDDYVLQILINRKDVRSFKFSISILDVIYNAIKDEMGIGINVFNCGDFLELTGRIVIFRVSNMETSTGNTFTNVKCLHFLTDNELKLIGKMIYTMYDQRGIK